MATIKERLEVIFGVSGADKFKKEFEQADKTVGKASKGMTSAMKGIGAAAVAYLSVQTVRAVVSTVNAYSRMADEFRVVQRSSDRLAKSIGQNSQAILQSVRRGVGGAVDDLAILKQVNTAILLGIPITANAMGNMAVVATRLGRAVGRDAASALGDLVTGIGRMSPLILDNLGITIKAEEAYRGLGEGATDAEKRLAFFNAVMKKANIRSEQLGDIAPSLTERWDKVNASFKNWATTITTSVLPAIESLATGIDKLIPKGQNKSAISEAIENPTINALRATSAGLRARGRGGDADLVDAQIRALQNSAVVGVASGLPGEVARQDNANRTASAGLLMRGPIAGGGPQMRVTGAQTINNKIGVANRQESQQEVNDRLANIGENSAGYFEGLAKGLKQRAPGFEETFKKIADDASDKLEKVPENMEMKFAKSFANISLGFSAIGVQGAGGLFANVANLGGGLSGLTGGGKDGPKWVTDKMLPMLETFGLAGQAFAGAVGIFKTASALLTAGLGTKELSSVAEIDAQIADFRRLKESGTNVSGLDLDDALVRLESARGVLAAGGGGASSGSNAYSVATSVSEAQANGIVAVLETQRAQDAERNNILGQSLAVQNDMKFLMSINSGNLTTFAG
jgi:hypothetical protein